MLIFFCQKSVDMVFFCVRMKPKNQLLTNLKLIIMKRIIFVCVTMLAVCFCADAKPKQKFSNRNSLNFIYFSPQAGVGVMDKKLGAYGGGSMGLLMSNGLNFEASVGYRRFGVNDVYQIGAGVGCDIQVFCKHYPYVIVGGGAAFNMPAYIEENTRLADPYVDYRVGWAYCIVPYMVELAVEYRGDCIFTSEKSTLKIADNKHFALQHSLGVVLRLYLPPL